MKGDRGERGPKGDHGQTGDTGPEGPPGVSVIDQAAERKRDRKAFKDAAVLLAVPVSIIMVAALLGMGYGIVLLIDNKVEERERTTYAICQESKKNRDALRTAVSSQGDPTKLKPGDYGYSYAQAHWNEALAQSEKVKAGRVEALKFFPPIVCTPPGGKPVTTKKEAP